MIITHHEGLIGQNSARSDLREGRHSWIKLTPQTSQRYENLVLVSPHTASGETSVHTPWADVERASNVGICLAK